MKTLIRNTTFYAISLSALTIIFAGIKIEGGLGTYIIAGIVLSVLFSVLKPILSLISLPLNIVTLGLFSFFINSIILYITTIIIPQIQIKAFMFNGINWAGFVIPQHNFGTLSAYVIIAGSLALLMNFFTWLTTK